ncbi:hypothetical protein [Nonomuraea guangzhouensis]|uniref:Uncharacterized protein n=1 Tax=Nonomuraea guangzhouensis TaxID=1291555 RepID=A0ABW4G7T5_9ACTN|nr:hypothetical protein [Nonomuraea guangzhouensis]
MHLPFSEPISRSTHADHPPTGQHCDVHRRFDHRLQSEDGLGFGHPLRIAGEEFEAGYNRPLAPLAEMGTELILIEPFLLPIHGVVQAVRELADK